MDLGGVHLAASGTVDMDFLAANSHGCHAGDPMQDSCITKLEADGSNFHLTSSISKFGAPFNAQPHIVEASVEPDGKLKIVTNASLSEETLANISAYGSQVPPIVGIYGEHDSFGMFTSEISSEGKSEKGYVYNLTGSLRNSRGEAMDFVGGSKDINFRQCCNQRRPLQWRFH